jgi:hypothetical protein
MQKRKKPDRTALTRLFKAIVLAAKMDLRVGQLLENVRSKYMNEQHMDLFYIENDVLAYMIETYVYENRPQTYEESQAEMRKYAKIAWGDLYRQAEWPIGKHRSKKRRK